jgi:hypothetical protein
MRDSPSASDSPCRVVWFRGALRESSLLLGAIPALPTASPKVDTLSLCFVETDRAEHGYQISQPRSLLQCAGCSLCGWCCLSSPMRRMPPAIGSMRSSGRFAGSRASCRSSRANSGRRSSSYANRGRRRNAPERTHVRPVRPRNEPGKTRSKLQPRSRKQCKGLPPPFPPPRTGEPPHSRPLWRAFRGPSPTTPRGRPGAGPRSHHPFSLADGGIGAWEIATRYSTVDLDSNVIPGAAQSLTGGVYGGQ